MRLGCAVRCRLVVSLTAPDTHPQAPPKPAPSSSEESSEDEDSSEEDVPMKVRRLGREARCDHPVRCTSPPFPASPRQQRRSRRVWCHFSGLLAVSVRAAAAATARACIRPSLPAANGLPGQLPNNSRHRRPPSTTATARTTARCVAAAPTRPGGTCTAWPHPAACCVIWGVPRGRTLTTGGHCHSFCKPQSSDDSSDDEKPAAKPAAKKVSRV